MKKRELIIVLCLLVIGAGFYFYQKSTKREELVVYHHKKMIAHIDLSKNARYAYQGDVGTFHLEVKDGRARAYDVDCPNQICVHTAWIKRDDGKSIVCAPNGISVSFETV